MHSALEPGQVGKRTASDVIQYKQQRTIKNAGNNARSDSSTPFLREYRSIVTTPLKNFPRDGNTARRNSSRYKVIVTIKAVLCLSRQFTLSKLTREDSEVTSSGSDKSFGREMFIEESSNKLITLNNEGSKLQPRARRF